jgi:hypothetical protein
MPIRNWAGVVLFAIGAWMLNAGLQRRRRARAAWQIAQQAGRTIDVGTSRKLAMTGLVARMIVYLVLLLVAAEVAMAYGAVGNRFFSLVDFGGFLFMLLGYAFWFGNSTRFRIIKPHELVPAQLAPAELAPAELATVPAEPG